jgi:protocatechuate 3,4-dioxygenase alpha subunit
MPNGDYAWSDAFTSNLVVSDIPGERIRIEGTIFDGDDLPVQDCMLEIWQADSQGRFSISQDMRILSSAGFKGFGRCGTDAQGRFSFHTIKPGSVPDADGKPQAPHLAIAVFARGMLRHLYSRIYFADERANANDTVLSGIPVTRRGTLIAQLEQFGSSRTTYRFDIRLQGDLETVFFDI